MSKICPECGSNIPTQKPNRLYIQCTLSIPGKGNFLFQDINENQEKLFDGMSHAIPRAYKEITGKIISIQFRDCKIFDQDNNLIGEYIFFSTNTPLSDKRIKK